MDRFHNAFMGYNKNEVNKFVSDVISEVEKMLTKSRQKDETIKLLSEQITRYKNMENTLNRVVLVAEEASHQIKKTARTEADVIIEDAKKNASRIVNDALMKAEEAEQAAENLRRNIYNYKKRVKTVIEEQLDVIDNLDKNIL
ncbi:MAG: DivIVA domain-containing protein [Mollicutes bacterium]|nr:DivIVA domain-containing protein [Mollicutes bacterium]